MKHIWQILPKPIWMLAPMENVTDTVFRQIVTTSGKPDLFFTEFTNVDGLCSQGRDRVAKRLQFTTIEQPLIAQVWGITPQHYYTASRMIKEMGFLGIDINMGCPDRSIVKKGACSALIHNHDMAQKIIEATIKGAGGLPVSVKTRMGYNKVATDEWIGFLLDLRLAAITLHARLATEMSKYPADWSEIGKAVAIRNEKKSKTLIIGNGDIMSREEGEEKVKQYGVDGVMVGRGIFHNAWIFNKDRSVDDVTVEERLRLLIDHIDLYDKTWGRTKPFDLMKKFYKVYVSGFPNASEFRMQLMEQPTPHDAIVFLEAQLQKSRMNT